MVTRVTDPEALAWEDHRYWQSLSIGERLRHAMELSEMVYFGKQTEPVNGLERLSGSTRSL